MAVAPAGSHELLLHNESSWNPEVLNSNHAMSHMCFYQSRCKASRGRSRGISLEPTPHASIQLASSLKSDTEVPRMGVSAHVGVGGFSQPVPPLTTEPGL